MYQNKCFGVNYWCVCKQLIDDDVYQQHMNVHRNNKSFGTNYCCVCKQMVDSRYFRSHVLTHYPQLQLNGVLFECPLNIGPGGWARGTIFSASCPAPPRQTPLPPPPLPAECVPKMPNFPGPYTCSRCGLSLGFDANAYAVHEVYCCWPYDDELWQYY